MSNLKTIEPGTRFGRLVVVSPGDTILRYGRNYSTSVCRCDCGRTVTIENCRILRRSRPQVSCGCGRRIQVHKRTSKHFPIISSGYKYVYCPEACGAAKRGSYKGYIQEHRLVMERALGRPLTKDEVVHHIDMNKLNNDVSNLILLSNLEHSILHARLRNSHVDKSDLLNPKKLRELVTDPGFKTCVDCGAPLSVSMLTRSAICRCVACSQLHARKVERPSREQLAQDVETTPYLVLEKRYGVCTVTIKKWMRAYGIPIPVRNKRKKI